MDRQQWKELDDGIRPLWCAADQLQYLCKEYLSAKGPKKRKKLRKELRVLSRVIRTKVRELSQGGAA